jgi:hypothetical protein
MIADAFGRFLKRLLLVQGQSQITRLQDVSTGIADIDTMFTFWQGPPGGIYVPVAAHELLYSCR